MCFLESPTIFNVNYSEVNIHKIAAILHSPMLDYLEAHPIEFSRTYARQVNLELQP